MANKKYNNQILSNKRRVDADYELITQQINEKLIELKDVPEYNVHSYIQTIAEGLYVSFGQNHDINELLNLVWEAYDEADNH